MERIVGLLNGDLCEAGYGVIKILLIVFENSVDVAMHALDERNVEIAAVVTAITPRMEERLQHYGLAERAVPYEQLDAALGEIDYNCIVFSEFGGGDGGRGRFAWPADPRRATGESDLCIPFPVCAYVDADDMVL